jgi:hypothetical protein
MPDYGVLWGALKHCAPTRDHLPRPQVGGTAMGQSDICATANAVSGQWDAGQLLGIEHLQLNE